MTVPQIDSAFLFPESLSTCAEITGGSEVGSSENKLPCTGLPIIKGNNDNNGMIIVKEQPFWVTDIPLDESEQTHVMNASLLIEVLENRLKVVPMPDIEIDFDPMGETKEIAAQDRLCYTKDVLFGNTVRNMVNLNELSIRTLSNNSRRKHVVQINSNDLNQLAMVEPTTKHVYYRQTYKQFNVIPFVPSIKEPAETCDQTPLFPTVTMT
ncbi:hypothetical protein DICVIV_07544 [Dictyocaulus viviparus]|uniref:Uncharacterized protein n=1 Tax=Dictyocaulus viviparus TaxID=29172 RepID=A0A0D8XVJ7_DICVI|nr:hypothetical protein DICVIV_07544 [Dictyocaulus viviparus]